MGQYFLYVNPRKREYVEQGAVGFDDKISGVFEGLPGRAVGLLLCDGGYDAGPLELVGSWIGDPIIVAGDDYGQPNVAGLVTTTESDPKRNLYHMAVEEFTDITLPAIAMLAYFSSYDAHRIARMALERDPSKDLLCACDLILRNDGCKPLEQALDGIDPKWREERRRASKTLSRWPSARFPVRERGAGRRAALESPSESSNE